jgi:hypothetical protein
MEPVDWGAVETTSLESGKAKAIAAALGDRLPVDAVGYPIGMPTERAVKAVRPPIGVSGREWHTALETATEYFRLTSGMVPLTKEAMKSSSDLASRVWDLIYHEDNLDTWHAALALKGMMKKGSGLTFEQMRALRFLTDVTNRGNLAQKLKKLGISWEVYQNWMRDAKFKAQFQAAAEQVLDEAQAPVALALTTGAIEGKLENIKYFHQITGKYQNQNQADVEKFMVGLVEILQGELSDHPELLRKIAGRLTALKDRTMGDG